jgi:hypothetical protein
MHRAASGIVSGAIYGTARLLLLGVTGLAGAVLGLRPQANLLPLQPYAAIAFLLAGPIVPALVAMVILGQSRHPLLTIVLVLFAFMKCNNSLRLPLRLGVPTQCRIPSSAPFLFQEPTTGKPRRQGREAGS